MHNGTQICECGSRCERGCKSVQTPSALPCTPRSAVQASGFPATSRSAVSSTHVMFPPSSMVSAVGGPRFGATPTVVDQFFCDIRKVYSKDPDYCHEGLVVCEPVSRGRIFFPLKSGLPQPGPIVVLCHGKPPHACDTPFYRGFDQLLKAIASKGMIAASIECKHAEEAFPRAQRILSQLTRIKSVIAKKRRRTRW